MRQSYGGGNSGHASYVMVRMSLKADARVADFDTVMFEMQRDTSAYGRWCARQGKDAAGLYAMYLGYDALKARDGYNCDFYNRGGGSYGRVTKPGSGADDWRSGFVIVLNRSAVRVSSKNYVGDSYVRSAPQGNDPPPLPYSGTRPRTQAQPQHVGTTDAAGLTKEP